MENTPQWLQYVLLFLGSSGILWTIWSKFGDAIRSGLSMKTDIKKSKLDLEREEMDVYKLHRATLEDDMKSMLDRYNNLKIQVDKKYKELQEKMAAENKKLTDQMKADRVVMQRQKTWIINASKLFKKHDIIFTPYTDE